MPHVLPPGPSRKIRTGIHHAEAYESTDPLFGTIELCVSCHRYAHRKDFGIKCIKCNGTDVVRDGIERNNRQRFLCRICKEIWSICKEIWSISKTDCEVFARFIDYRLEVCRYILSTLLKRKQTKEIKHRIDEISGIISHLTRIK
ncbi:MAG: IS1 family transposase [Candidatus Nitrosopolaris sp.]